MGIWSCEAEVRLVSHYVASGNGPQILGKNIALPACLPNSSLDWFSIFEFLNVSFLLLRWFYTVQAGLELLPLSAGVTGVNPHVWFMQCWRWNPGLREALTG